MQPRNALAEADPFVAPARVTELELSEDDVARLFTAQHGGSMRFDHDAGRWYEFDGARWRPDTTSRAFNYCRELAREASTPAARNAQISTRRSAFASGVEKMARSDPKHAVTQDVWDADPFLLGCPDATVDLRSGIAREPDATEGITKLTAVTPAETADCPRWLAFLEEATAGDAELIRFLRAWSGYCLTGDTREHALLFIYGPGGNGKSVFLNVLEGILGDYAVTASMDTFTASRSDKHPTDLAMLRGARFVTASETEEGRAWAESRIKSLTGGDKITARFMRMDFFTFSPEFKLTVVGNHKPALVNVDDAARRRFKIVPFIHRPAHPDKQLEAKLRAEWPGILRWMIDGCLDWQTNGLPVPASVAAATEQYFSDQDLFGQWLEETCTIERSNQHRWAASGELFASWSNFAKTAGEEPGTARRLADRMRLHGLEPSKGSKGMRIYRGVTLNTVGGCLE